MEPKTMREALKKYNVREIAGEIGVHPQTIYRFLGGAPISFETQHMIRGWFARQAEECQRAAGVGDE